MKLFRILLSSCRNYFSNSTVHGLKFIAEDGRHWSERFLWIGLCLLSWVGSALLISASWDAFQNNAISFVTETSYLKFNTSFPSISVCEEDNMARVYEAAQEMFGEQHDSNLDEVLKEITYFRGTAYYMKEFCTSKHIGCPRSNFKEVSDRVRSRCSDIFSTCHWRGTEFNCCEHFQPRETELGICFTFSTTNERNRMKRKLPYLSLISNRKTKLGSLTLKLKISSKVYLHSEAEVPFYNSMTSDVLVATLNMVKSYGISIIDIENGPDVHQLSVHQRQCRFAHENYLPSSDQYSYSGCVVECRRLEQMRLCNCTSHLMPKSQPREWCDMNGLMCLYNHYDSLSVQKTTWSKKDGLICDCLPSCEDSEKNVISFISQYIPENYSAIDIFLDRLPSERYKRNVVRGRLDLVVSMGGAAGLFVGASLLSFVEILYFFIFRSGDHNEKQIPSEELENRLDSKIKPTVENLGHNLPTERVFVGRVDMARRASHLMSPYGFLP